MCAGGYFRVCAGACLLRRDPSTRGCVDWLATRWAGGEGGGYNKMRRGGELARPTPTAFYYVRVGQLSVCSQVWRLPPGVPAPACPAHSLSQGSGVWRAPTNKSDVGKETQCPGFRITKCYPSVRCGVGLWAFPKAARAQPIRPLTLGNASLARRKDSTQRNRCVACHVLTPLVQIGALRHLLTKAVAKRRTFNSPFANDHHHEMECPHGMQGREAVGQRTKQWKKIQGGCGAAEAQHWVTEARGK